MPSLSMDSPEMIVMSRRGRCRRRPTLAVVTASVGATIAPRVSATASGTPGTVSRTVVATQATVNSTRPTDSRPMGRMLSLMLR